MNVNKLESLIAERRLSKADLLRRCGLSRPAFESILNGGDCKITTLEKIAVALGVPVSYFFDEETPAAPGRSAGRDYVERGSITHAAADTPELVAALRAQIADLQADKKHLQSIIDHLLRQ